MTFAFSGYAENGLEEIGAPRPVGRGIELLCRYGLDQYSAFPANARILREPPIFSI